MKRRVDIIRLDGEDPAAAVRSALSSAVPDADPTQRRFVFVERADELGEAELSAVVDRLPTVDSATSTVVARVGPMTDALKRVDGSRVVTSVDRSRLRVVHAPLVVAADLAGRWAAAGSGGPTTVAALLSELASIEPDLRVVGFDPAPDPGDSHG